MSELTKSEVRKLWIEALESGDYKQGKGFLKREVGDEVHYCCLGVLCELAVEHGVTPASTRAGQTALSLFEGDSHFPPTSVVEWAGLKYADGDFIGGFEGEPVNSLTEANDASENFTEVITILKSAPEGLFEE